MENVTLTKFSVWENDLKNFKPENLVGTYQYFYNYDSNNFPISVNYAMIYNMIKKIPVIISSSDNTIQYNDMELITSVNKEIFVFGKSFNIDYTNHTFNITIKGTLKERINAIKFSIQLLEKSFFYVNDKKFVLTDFDRKEQKKFEELLEKYIELEKVLQKHNISSSSSINSLLLNFMFPDLSSLIASADKPSVNKIAYGTFVTFFELYISVKL